MLLGLAQAEKSRNMNQPSSTGPVPLIGPLDIEQIADRSNFVDFGKILIPSNIPNVVLKGEIEPDSSRLVAITIETASSSLQVSVFSTTKTEEIWPAVRIELATSLRAQGAQVEEESSSLGTGLKVLMPSDKSTKGAERQSLRFVGFDGPRWFLRGSIAGAALSNPDAKDEIEAIFRSLVVDRGDEPMPPRELLTLRLPEGNIAPPRQL